MAARQALRRLAATAAFVVVVVLTSSPVSARRLVVVTDLPAFAVSITLADDDVTVDCSGGFVRVFVNGFPSIYTTACAAVTSLTITATGLFIHTIDIQNVTPAAFTSLTSPVVSGGGRDDRVLGSPFPDVILGNGGDDELFGFDGADAIDGGSSDDVIRGGPGNDILNGGTGLDQFDWAPGDGSDLIDGGSERDNFAFDGSAANEIFTVSPNGGGFIFTRDVGGVTMTVSNVELISLRAFGGDDIVNTVGLANTEQNLDGGAQTSADTINLDAQGACVAVTPSTYTVPGAQLITYTDFETANLLNPCAVPTMGPSGLAMLAAALLAIGLATTYRRRFAVS